ncbi:MAG: LacI family transcriptional regulator, partial [Clostridiales bacterium]|nr:LacI family transcriptional regulator [Clostridiales bacterium]
MRQNGLELREGGIQYTMADYRSGYNSMRALLELNDRPTAVFCSDDAIASFAVRAALDMGLRVPEDVSVMGFDNQSILPEKYAGPEITSMEQPLFAIGCDSIRLLVDQLTGKVASPVKRIYQTKVVEKASVRRLKA